MHYSRVWEGRDIGGPEPLRGAGRVCKVPDCGRPHSGHGYCVMHYERWRKHGDPEVRLVIHGGDDIGYGAAHDRVKRARGYASEHPCAHCGARAEDWAYDHRDPDEKWVENRGKVLPISLRMEHYLALCRTCHRHFDLGRITSNPEVPVVDCGYFRVT